MKSWILLLPLLAGCGAYTLAIEKEFEPDEIRLTKDAVEEWMQACDCYDASIFWRYDLPTTNNLQYSEWLKNPGYGRLWKVYTFEDAYIKGKELDGKCFRGMYNNGNIMMVADNIGGNFYEVMLHELGHLYGVNHQVSGIMAPSGSSDECVDWLALSEFCLLHKCGPNAAPTCDENE